MAFVPSKVLARFAFQPSEPPPKRLRMSSTTSESTLAGDTPTIITAGHVTHSVASEDLSSMVFQAAELQGFASTWSSYMPITINEHVMADSLRNCEDIANSLRDALESLEVIPVSPAPARDSEDVSHSSPKDNDNADGNGSSAHQLKYVRFFLAGRAQALTVWQGGRDSQVPHPNWYREDNRQAILKTSQVRSNFQRCHLSQMVPQPGNSESPGSKSHR